jgi:MFS family permease
MSVNATPADEGAEASAAASPFSWYVLGVLTLTYGMSFLDRSVLNLLLEPIKKEFQLSDTALGLMAGLGFVCVYSTLGMYIGRLGDRMNRINIVGVAFAIWSVMTGLTGAVTSVFQLVLCRLGVAAGESALQGPAHSLISDYFPNDSRTRALAVFSIGPYLGIFLGFNWAGFLSQYYGWRVAFLGCCIPGLIVALAAWLTIPEPARGQSEAKGARIEECTFGEAMRFLIRQKTFVLCVAAYCLTSYTNFGMSVWLPAFLGRVHHLTPVQIGLWAGTIKGGVGMLMAIVGGVIIDRFKGPRESWRLSFPAWCSMIGGPAFAILLWPDDFATAMVGLVLGVALTAIHGGAVYAAVQSVAKVRMRALAGAIVVLGSSFAGSTIGPAAVGWLNDTLAASLGQQAIRYSMLTTCVASMLGALCLFAAARTLAEDRKRALAE